MSMGGFKMGCVHGSGTQQIIMLDESIVLHKQLGLVAVIHRGNNTHFSFTYVSRALTSHVFGMRLM